MKRNKSVLVIILAVVLLAQSFVTLFSATGAGTAGETLFFEDFESYTAGERPPGFTNRNQNVSQSTLSVVQELDGNKMLQVRQTATVSASQWYVKRLDEAFTGILTVDIQMSTTGTGAFFWLCDDSDRIISQIDFRPTINDGIRINDGSTMPLIMPGPYELGKLYDIHFELDTYNSTYTVSIDGGTPVSYGFREAAVNLGGYRVGTFSSSVATIKYDNLHIKRGSDPKPQGSISFRRSGELQATFSVNNKSSSGNTVIAMMATYDSSGKMIDLISKEIELAPNTTQFISNIIPKPIREIKEGDCVKGFLWDMADYTPICPAATWVDDGIDYENSLYEDPDYIAELLAQGEFNGDAVTSGGNDLSVTDMVHNNPGLERYTSNYTDPVFLKSRGYDGKVFFLYEAAQFGLFWDKYDGSRGITFTEEQYNANPSAYPQNSNKVFPFGSVERAWVANKKAQLKREYDEAVQAGEKIYFMMDTITLPTHLVSMDSSNILNGSNIDIKRSGTKRAMDYMFAEMFTEFPEIDGIYIRYGENYVGANYGTPYHRGNNPMSAADNQTNYQKFFISYLRDRMCLGNYLTSDTGPFDNDVTTFAAKSWEGKLYDQQAVPRELVYRTWGFGSFQNNRTEYLSVSNTITPHDKMLFCIKISGADFWRLTEFNQTINVGNHNQIIEVQCAREYEGKGAYPNYVGSSSINGFEEFRWMMSPQLNQSLRDVINVPNSRVKGIWTWSRGGGWYGPYINGVNGRSGVYSEQNNPDGIVEIPDGSEMWNDLNAYVVTNWAKDTSKTDKFYTLKYAREILGMNNKDAANFYRLCLLSSRAILLGRATDTQGISYDRTWTRDMGITSAFYNNITNNVNNGRWPKMLEEREESVLIWREMLRIAESFDGSLASKPLIDSPVSVKDYIVTTCKYGLYMFTIFEQMHKSRTYYQLGINSGNIAEYVDRINEAVKIYDDTWVLLYDLYASAPGCPQPYFKYNRSVSYCNGLDSAIDPIRFRIAVNSPVSVLTGRTSVIGVTYVIGSNTIPMPQTDFNFVSNDEAVATVNANGVVTGVSVGQTTVIVTSKDGAYSATVVVYVSDQSSSDIIYIDDFEDYTAGVMPEGFTKSGGSGTDGTALTVEKESGGSQVLQFVRPGSVPSSVYFTKYFNADKTPFTGQMSVDADILMTGLGAYFLLIDENGLIISQIHFMNNGVSVTVNDGSGTPPAIISGTYLQNHWYKLHFEINTLSKGYTVSLDGSPVVSLRFRTATGGLAGYQVGAPSVASHNTVKVDNFVVRRDILFWEDYESYATGVRPDGFINRNTTTSSTLTVEQYKPSGSGANSFTQRLQVNQTSSPSASQWYRKAFDQVLRGVYTVDVDVTFTGRGTFFFLYDENNLIISQIDFRDEAAQNIYVSETGGIVRISTASAYTLNQLYHLRFVVNTFTRTYTVSVNGSQPFERSFREATGGLAQYAVGIASTVSSSRAQFDNLIIRAAAY